MASENAVSTASPNAYQSASTAAAADRRRAARRSARRHEVGDQSARGLERAQRRAALAATSSAPSTRTCCRRPRTRTPACRSRRASPRGRSRCRACAPARRSPRRRGAAPPTRRREAVGQRPQRCSGLGKSKRQPASHAERWLPCAGMPPASLSIRATCSRFHVMNVGVAVGEVVLGPPEPGVEVARARAGLADPAGVGLRRDRVAEVLQRVEDVHRAVLDAVLVAGDEAAADAAVVGVLAGVVEQVRVAVQALDHLRADRRLLAEPDRRDAARGCRRPSPARRSRASRRASQPCSVMSGQTPVAMSWSIARTLLDGDAVALHDRDRAIGEPLRVRDCSGERFSVQLM